MQRDRRKRLAKQHLAGAEDSVDAVYMALAGAAHAQANAAESGRRRLRGALVDAEDYVDAVYMVLAAGARTKASASRNALAWNLRPTRAGQLKKGLALRSATHACKASGWQPGKRSRIRSTASTRRLVVRPPWTLRIM